MIRLSKIVFVFFISLYIFGLCGLSAAVSPKFDIEAATPTALPTETYAPTEPPTPSPSTKPTRFPTASPTTPAPTTRFPTTAPTAKPTRIPTAVPTDAPTAIPTYTSSPTEYPTPKPTTKPTRIPTAIPSTAKPSVKPSRVPTHSPTHATDAPTAIPTETSSPTEAPVSNPTIKPTKVPILTPTTGTPSLAPTSGVPSRRPTKVPTDFPTYHPTPEPTESPSNSPTVKPTAQSLQLPVPELFSGSSCWSHCLQEISDKREVGYCSFFSQISNCHSSRNVSSLECIPVCMQSITCASEYCSVFSVLAATCIESSSSAAASAVADVVKDDCQHSVALLTPSTSPFTGLTNPIEYLVFNVSIAVSCSHNCSASVLNADHGALESIVSSVSAMVPGTALSTIEVLELKDASGVDATIESVVSKFSLDKSNRFLEVDAADSRGVRGDSRRTIGVESASTGKVVITMTIYSSLSTIVNYTHDGTNLTLAKQVYQTLLLKLQESINASDDFNYYWSTWGVPGYCSRLNSTELQHHPEVWCTVVNPPSLHALSVSVPPGQEFIITSHPRIYQTTDDEQGGGGSGGGQTSNAALIGGIVGGATGAIGVGAVAYKVISDNANSIKAPMSAVGDFDIPLEGL